jgi:hypothetical protein
MTCGRLPAGVRSSRRPSIELISEGVVASYLHEISGRNHHRAQASDGFTRRAAHR